MQREESDYAKNSKQIMTSGASKLTPGKRTQLASAGAGAGPYDIHMMAESIGTTTIVFFAMTTTDFSKVHQVTVLLDDFKTRFLTSNSQSDIEKAKANGNVNRASQPLMEALFVAYGSDKLANVRGKVDQVKGVMQENIKIALDNTEDLNQLEDKSAAFEEEANRFHKDATRVKTMMRCRNYKLMAVVGGIILLVLIIIIIAAVA